MTIVDYIGEIAERTGGRPLPLAEPTKTQLDRLWSVYVAQHRGQASLEDVEEVADRVFEYLERCDHAEEQLALSFIVFLFEHFLGQVDRDKFIDHWLQVKEHEPHCPARRRRR